jgi:hypothetical protein
MRMGLLKADVSRIVRDGFLGFVASEDTNELLRNLYLISMHRARDSDIERVGGM